MDRPVDDRAQALLIIGTVGAGKTSVADALGDSLSHRGIANAVVDVDWLRRFWPSPPDDPFNRAITLRNLHAVAGNYLETGAQRLVLAGVVESRAEREDYQTALGVPLTVCRLRVELPTVRQRLVKRHNDDPGGLRWHLNRSGELEAILEQAQTEDIVVDATTGSVLQVAQAVTTAIGW